MADTRFLELITSRASVRAYTDEPVSRGEIDALIEAARWAPSGMNNQPWRFVTVEGRQTLETLASFTKYGKILRTAPAAIAVFLDNSAVYNRTKDVQSIGAAFENILLAAHALGLGACWLGEILNRREDVEKALGVSKEMELMGVISLGRPKRQAANVKRERVGFDRLILGRF